MQKHAHLFALPCFHDCQLLMGIIYRLCMHTAVLQNLWLRNWHTTAGHSWVRTRKTQGEVKMLFYSFRTACSWALTGSARGKACGQALAGSLGPRGTAWAPSMLHILKKRFNVSENRETQRKEKCAVLNNTRHLCVSQHGWPSFIITARPLCNA